MSRKANSHKRWLPCKNDEKASRCIHALDTFATYIIGALPSEKVPSGHVRTAKAQIRLRECAVWSGSSHSANIITGYYRMFQCRANNLMTLRFCRMMWRWVPHIFFCMFEDIFSLDPAHEINAGYCLLHVLLWTGDSMIRPLRCGVCCHWVLSNLHVPMEVEVPDRNMQVRRMILIYTVLICSKTLSLNPCPAEPGYTLSLQTV